jgi:hypothetical protein
MKYAMLADSMPAAHSVLTEMSAHPGSRSGSECRVNPLTSCRKGGQHNVARKSCRMPAMGHLRRFGSICAVSGLNSTADVPGTIAISAPAEPGINREY